MIALSRLGYIIAVRRIVSAWWLELVLFAGILLGVSLLASGVIFSDMLAEAGGNIQRRATGCGDSAGPIPTAGDRRTELFRGSDSSGQSG